MSSITRLIKRTKARLQGGPDLKALKDEKDDESFSWRPRPVLSERNVTLMKELIPEHTLYRTKITPYGYTQAL